jgi:flagellar biosynthesis chaperone FliJ
MAGTSFHFEFDSVLQLRDRTVEMVQDALGRAVRARLAQEARVAAASEALAATLAAEGTPGGIAARLLVDAAAYRTAAAEALRAAQHELGLLTEAERLTRRSLADALRAREALRTLRASAEESHRETVARAETALLDDLTASRIPQHVFSAAA